MLLLRRFQLAPNYYCLIQNLHLDAAKADAINQPRAPANWKNTLKQTAMLCKLKNELIQHSRLKLIGDKGRIEFNCSIKRSDPKRGNAKSI